MLEPARKRLFISCAHKDATAPDIPLLAHPQAERPLHLETAQYRDFTKCRPPPRN